MELLPFLIFAVIAFNIFKGFSKSAAAQKGRNSKDLMRQLNEEFQRASKAQGQNQDRYRDKSPTQRGRESLEAKSQSTPWDSGGHGGSVSPGARVAVEYLKSQKRAQRKASHKSPIQRGRRGKNMDQNRNRTDEWGQRGDSGLLSGKAFIILLFIGGALLYALSNMPAL